MHKKIFWKLWTDIVVVKSSKKDNIIVCEKYVKQMIQHEGGKTQEGGVELCFRNLKLFGS
jgi:hypothetical protein